MKVCVAEKPSVAREIAQIIGANTKRDGYLEGNGYCVSWTFGHFCTLKTPDDYQPHWKKWDLNTLPMLPPVFEIKLIDNAGVKKQFGILKKLFQQAEVVINCGDAGQEGELIQRWVLKEAGYKGPVQRLWISSLTAEAIKDGFLNLRDASHFDNLYYAGFSRAIGDWLLGMNATRLYTLKYGGYKQVLSIGRVQTPTLAMLVERHLEIQNFVPQTYWELQTEYRETTFNCTEGKFTKKEEGEALLAKVTDKAFTITSVEKKNGKETPPRLFDLTSLQVHGNKRFAYSADQTLKIAQKLYEQKLITYPRVDTTYLPNDLYPKISGILSRLNQYSQFTQTLLGKKIRKTAKVFNDKKVTDHHAIIPTGVERSLPENEQKVYDAITRRFIAAFYPDCLVANTTVLGESEKVPFKATGKEILDPGWRVLFPKPKKKRQESPGEEKEEEKILPAFTVAESGPHLPSLAEKQTKPPKTYSEATLLRAMETAGKKVDDEKLRDLMKASGIGRPSTRANIIETLFKRRYIQRKKKQIIPTETGIQLIQTIQNELLKSAELTGQWEKQLREIEAGTYKVGRFVNDMKRMVSSLVEEVRLSQNTVRFTAQTTPNKKTKGKSPKPNPPIPNTLSCPKCEKGQVLKGKSAYGCNRYQEGCDFRLPFVFMGKKISDKQIRRLLQKGSTIQLKGFQDKGGKKVGKLRFNDQFQLILVEKPRAESQMPEVLRCPKCGVGTVIKGKTAFGCSRWKAGCDFQMPFAEVRQKAAGKKMSKALVWEIIQG
jgi:DNA topoisomerase-3